MMDKELATLLDATSFQVADLVGPAIVIEAAANHLLSRLPETDEHRWKVTEALGSIVAARKSLESAAESLLHIVAQDGADMLAMEVDGGTIVDKPQCSSRYVFPGDTEMDQPTRCRREAGHVGVHADHEGQWHDDAAYRPPASFSVSQADLVSPPPSLVDRIQQAQLKSHLTNPYQL